MLYFISGLSLFNNGYCDISIYILNFVIPIINSVTSVNLKKAGMANRNIVMKKTKHVVMISFVVVFGLLVFWIF